MTKVESASQQKTCAYSWCKNSFSVTSEDLAFYEKVSPVFHGKKELIPPPTLCPECRMQRRFAYRNEHHLYKRTCDLSGRAMISFYPANSSFIVYNTEAWWSDAWDGLNAGKEISFDRPFFQQIGDIRRATPRQGMMSTQSEGSSYSAYCMYTKNCYMCVSCVVNEDSAYCYQANDSKNCVDCSSISKCELCYECLYCYGLYSSVHCKDCENGSGLAFCEECRGCSDCIGCKNLVNKKNCIFNIQMTAEDYRVHRKRLASYRDLQTLAEEYHALSLTLPTRATHMSQCENVTGDHLRECRNVRNCFDAIGLEDCAYVSPCPQATKDTYDAHYCPQSELVYEGMSIVRSTQCLFSLFTWDSHNVLYSDECFNCHDLFGCIGLRQKQYCILNRQYSKEEYESLVPKLIEHMRKTCQWGEYFPVEDSPFTYNETIAADDCKLSQEEVMHRGWRWMDVAEEMPEADTLVSSFVLPDSINETGEEILQKTLRCCATGKPYRLTHRELNFYRQMSLPIPRLHPRTRYENRIKKRNPRRLWERDCKQCGETVRTTYAPDRAAVRGSEEPSGSRREIITCEKCYLKDVY
jgi:hypothetical protein